MNGRTDILIANAALKLRFAANKIHVL